MVLINLFFINLIANGFIAMLVPPLFPDIADEFGLNYTQIGSMWGASPMGMLLFAFIGGTAADRFGVKKVLSIAILFVSISAGSRGVASGCMTLWLCHFFMGVGLARRICGDKVLVRRALLDRDITSHEKWIRREPSHEDEWMANGEGQLGHSRDPIRIPQGEVLARRLGINGRFVI